jgi:hypothetical protein
LHDSPLEEAGFELPVSPPTKETHLHNSVSEFFTLKVVVVCPRTSRKTRLVGENVKDKNERRLLRNEPTGEFA